ncbi:MAG: hypothetical protein RR929_00585 [Erysipelotrichaceae bacterium]
MAEIKKIKKTKKFNVYKMTQNLFVFSLLLFLATNLILKSYNVTLQYKAQTLEETIQAETEKKQTLKLEIDQLGSRERVMAIVEKDGFKLNQNNVVGLK